MNIPDHVAILFEAMLKAASQRALVLMVAKDLSTGASLYLICAMGREGKTMTFAPFGQILPPQPVTPQAWTPDEPASTLH